MGARKLTGSSGTWAGSHYIPLCWGSLVGGFWLLISCLISFLGLVWFPREGPFCLEGIIPVPAVFCAEVTVSLPVWYVNFHFISGHIQHRICPQWLGGHRYLSYSSTDQTSRLLLRVGQSCCWLCTWEEGLKKVILTTSTEFQPFLQFSGPSSHSLSKESISTHSWATLLWGSSVQNWLLLDFPSLGFSFLRAVKSATSSSSAF